MGNHHSEDRPALDIASLHVQIRPPEGVSPRKPLFRNQREANLARGLEAKWNQGRFRHPPRSESTSLTEARDRYEREITPRKKGASQEKPRPTSGATPRSGTVTAGHSAGSISPSGWDARFKAKNPPLPSS